MLYDLWMDLSVCSYEWLYSKEDNRADDQHPRIDEVISQLKPQARLES
jgi:hypothetical protein